MSGTAWPRSGSVARSLDCLCTAACICSERMISVTYKRSVILDRVSTGGATTTDTGCAGSRPRQAYSLAAKEHQGSIWKASTPLVKDPRSVRRVVTFVS